MNLLNKFRPSTIEEVIGNKTACNVIKKNISSKTPPHTYMIIGPTGSGKTTLARIIASLLGGEKFDVCEMQLRGIDDARALRDEIGTVPMFGKSKIYILDEIHHLTKDGQNDLLKPFEEPPAHVYFIINTTEPKKIIKTIQSRCVKIKTEPLSESESIELLRRISDTKLNKEVEDAIAKKSEGLPRNIITNYGAVRGLSDPRTIFKTLSIVPEDDEEVIELIRKVVYKSKSWEEVSKYLSKMDVEPETIRIIFCNWLQKAILGAAAPRAMSYARMLGFFLTPYHYSQTAKSNLTHDILLAFSSRFKRGV